MFNVVETTRDKGTWHLRIIPVFHKIIFHEIICYGQNKVLRRNIQNYPVKQGFKEKYSKLSCKTCF